MDNISESPLAFPPLAGPVISESPLVLPTRVDPDVEANSEPALHFSPITLPDPEEISESPLTFLPLAQPDTEMGSESPLTFQPLSGPIPQEVSESPLVFPTIDNPIVSRNTNPGGEVITTESPLVFSPLPPPAERAVSPVQLPPRGFTSSVPYPIYVSDPRDPHRSNEQRQLSEEDEGGQPRLLRLHVSSESRPDFYHWYQRIPMQSLSQADRRALENLYLSTVEDLPSPADREHAARNFLYSTNDEIEFLNDVLRFATRASDSLERVLETYTDRSVIFES